MISVSVRLVRISEVIVEWIMRALDDLVELAYGLGIWMFSYLGWIG